MSNKLTAKEAAEILGYSARHVHKLLKLGAMEGECFNRVWIIDRAEVERVRALQSEGGRFFHGKTGKGTDIEEN